MGNVMIRDKEGIIKLFKEFPEATYNGKLYDVVMCSKKGFRIYASRNDVVTTLTLFINYMGCLRKQWEYPTERKQGFYRFSYSIDVQETFFFSRRINKETSDILCARLIPFMVSQGQDQRYHTFILTL